MFERIDRSSPSDQVAITVNGQPHQVPADIPLASALLLLPQYPTRHSPVHERDGPKRRAPYCMMGVCFECLVEIDGVPNQQSCLVKVRDGMVIRRQDGAADAESAAAAAGGEHV